MLFLVKGSAVKCTKKLHCPLSPWVNDKGVEVLDQTTLKVGRGAHLWDGIGIYFIHYYVVNGIKAG